jgi:hypothetical protein
MLRYQRRELFGWATSALAVLAMLAVRPVAAAEIKSPVSHAERAEGYSAVAHQKDPESWLRGRASLDTTTGAITIETDLETDSTTAGPKGRVSVTLRDAKGAALATVNVGEIGRGGKKPGVAEHTRAKGKASVPPAIAARAASVDVTATITGKETRLFNIPLKDVINAAVIVVKILASS